MFGLKLYMFRTVPLSIIGSYSLTHQRCMLHSFVNSLLANCQQTCVYICTLLMMDRGTNRNM